MKMHVPWALHYSYICEQIIVKFPSIRDLEPFFAISLKVLSLGKYLAPENTGVVGSKWGTSRGQWPFESFTTFLPVLIRHRKETKVSEG